MFEFPREYIINDKKRFEKSDANLLIVEKMVNLKAKNITNVTHKAYEDPANESVTLDLSGVKAFDPNDPTTEIDNAICRLVITITEEGRVTALVNDQYPIHKKQYFYEGLSGTSGVMPIDTWINQASREANHEQEDRLISLEAVGGNPATGITISANDPYTRIAEIRIVQVPAYDRTAAQAMTGYQDYKVLYLGNKANQFTTTKVTPDPDTDIILGSLGAGTVSHILKDVRLLTAANINPYGLNRDERPVPGGKYDQFNIEYVVEERNKNHNVFGSIAHTLTTHIFFVESDAVSDFTAALTAMGITPDEVGTASTTYTLPEPVIATVNSAATSGDSVTVTIPATSIDGTNPTDDVEVTGTID